MEIILVCSSAVLGLGLAMLSYKPLRAYLWPKVVVLHRFLSVFCYPIPILCNLLVYWSPTERNAQWFFYLTLATWLPLSCVFYLASWKGMIATTWLGFGVKHFLWFYVIDLPMFVVALSAVTIKSMFSRKSSNRLFGEKPEFYGDRIVILGNGPSLVKGVPCGESIDGMDEVVRFNNFQTKNSGLQEFTGEKTTVHFSDSMLFPSYPEYHSPGATVALSLFMDRLMVAGSYLIFRCGADLAFKEALDMLLNPSLGWIPHEDINNLKKELGIHYRRHPTSGCLAIDWFVRNRPNPDVPVYIQGFDFFEGPEIHYYNKTEPLYERINDLVGVTTMHEPHKEKAFVAQLVAEGKVEWLKDAKRSVSPNSKKNPSLHGGA